MVFLWFSYGLSHLFWGLHWHIGRAQALSRRPAAAGRALPIEPSQIWSESMPDTTPMLMAYGVVMVWHGTVMVYG